jgi:DNA-binding transcriptional MerR regulator
MFTMAFTIKELESLSGIKAHTIRIWEQRYHFLKPDRTTTNIRTYSNNELKTLLTVALLNKYGYKISHIDKMQPGQRADAILDLKEPGARNEFLMNELVGFMIDLQHIPFEEILNNHIRQHSLPETLHALVFPFLEKTGILWQADRINPAQEHVVSNIIRQKIISALDSLPFSRKKEPLFLLFLPEDEHHELGLLFVYYLLKARNLPVIYLGANVPLADVFYVLQIKQPSFLYLHLTSFPGRLHFGKFLQQLSSQPVSCKILISGGVTNSYQKPVPSNVIFFQSFFQLNTYISSI